MNDHTVSAKCISQLRAVVSEISGRTDCTDDEVLTLAAIALEQMNEALTRDNHDE